MTTGALRLYFIGRVDRKWENMLMLLLLMMLLLWGVSHAYCCMFWKCCTVNQHSRCIKSTESEYSGWKWIWWLVAGISNRTDIPIMEPYGVAFKWSIPNIFTHTQSEICGMPIKRQKQKQHNIYNASTVHNLFISSSVNNIFSANKHNWNRRHKSQSSVASYGPAMAIVITLNMICLANSQKDEQMVVNT